MKIDGYRPANEADAAEAARRAETERERRTERADGASGAQARDRVEVSSDVQFAARAVEQASAAPDIRPDVVERARAQLESGTLGQDAHRLADKLIDSLLP
ncbi:MAG: flagellar biosynthesis anti-sigma factor FlgM [Vicinamibacterales bacterium]